MQGKQEITLRVGAVEERIIRRRASAEPAQQQGRGDASRSVFLLSDVTEKRRRDGLRSK